MTAPGGFTKEHRSKIAKALGVRPAQVKMETARPVAWTVTIEMDDGRRLPHEFSSAWFTLYDRLAAEGKEDELTILYGSEVRHP